jgi:hypothetical protein
MGSVNKKRLKVLYQCSFDLRISDGIAPREPLSKFLLKGQFQEILGFFNGYT